jgi:uncharacterized protein with PIN domain
MPIRCPGCGRAYPDERFAFGRTLHCACGRRVGTALLADLPANGDGPPRFAVDAMLGRLARWLRLLGFDVRYAPDVADADLVRAALEEARWILTRDRALPEEWRVPRVHLVAAEAPLDQLREVVDAFDLAARAAPFARCTRCNALLEPLAPEAAAGRVPPRVHAAHERFWHCPGCGRIYWAGSHVERMRRTLDRVLGGR